MKDIDVKDFINPKSMLTPGAAAAIVTGLSGTFFYLFSLSHQFGLLIFSFFIGCVVFFSKEFEDPKMSRGGKVFFYLLNSLIILWLAAGTHVMLDRTEKGGFIGASHSSNKFFISTAYAQESSEAPTTVVKQKRPFFYDWTRSANLVPKSHNPKIIKYDVDMGSYSSIKKPLVKLRILVPSYKIRVNIDQSKIDPTISAVTYIFPKGYFNKEQVTSENKNTNFGLLVEAWKPFILAAEIQLVTGKTLKVDSPIMFELATVK